MMELIHREYRGKPLFWSLKLSGVIFFDDHCRYYLKLVKLFFIQSLSEKNEKKFEFPPKKRLFCNFAQKKSEFNGFCCSYTSLTVDVHWNENYDKRENRETITILLSNRGLRLVICLLCELGSYFNLKFLSYNFYRMFK